MQASIHRFVENLYVKDRTESSSWIGLTREAGMKTFSWTDKTDLEVEFWADEGLLKCFTTNYLESSLQYI